VAFSPMARDSVNPMELALRLGSTSCVIVDGLLTRVVKHQRRADWAAFADRSGYRATRGRSWREPRRWVGGALAGDRWEPGLLGLNRGPHG
jgi:hypothetical protein